jgi:hypothetical protein
MEKIEAIWPYRISTLTFWDEYVFDPETDAVTSGRNAVWASADTDLGASETDAEVEAKVGPAPVLMFAPCETCGERAVQITDWDDGTMRVFCQECW